VTVGVTHSTAAASPAIGAGTPTCRRPAHALAPSSATRAGAISTTGTKLRATPIPHAAVTSAASG
jgi:hypothetical protein